METGTKTLSPEQLADALAEAARGDAAALTEALDLLPASACEALTRAVYDRDKDYITGVLLAEDGCLVVGQSEYDAMDKELDRLRHEADYALPADAVSLLEEAQWRASIGDHETSAYLIERVFDEVERL